MQFVRSSKIILFLLIVIFGVGLTAQTKVPRQPIARIGNQGIYEEDLLPAIGGQLVQLKNQEFELRSKALENLLNQRLLEAEAKIQGISVEALLQRVDQNLPPWSVSELEGYYLAQKDRINKPFAAVRPQLEQAFIQAKRQEARQGFVDQLRQKSDVAVLINRPRVDVAADPSRLRGNQAATVTIVEFADFQCPYCRAVQPNLKEVLHKYDGRVRLGFRDFPLRSIHPQAQAAAEAARCAGEQGRFWEYHDLLYANQTALTADALKEHARSAGLDEGQFRACLDSGKFKMQIESDLQLGMASGVTGAPAFYINGVLLSGSQPLSAFEKIIDAELSSTAANQPAPRNTATTGP